MKIRIPLIDGLMDVIALLGVSIALLLLALAGIHSIIEYDNKNKQDKQAALMQSYEDTCAKADMELSHIEQSVAGTYVICRGKEANTRRSKRLAYLKGVL